MHLAVPGGSAGALGVGNDPPHLPELDLAREVAVGPQQHRHRPEPVERDGDRKRARARTHQHADVLALAHADRDQPADDVVDPGVDLAGGYRRGRRTGRTSRRARGGRARSPATRSRPECSGGSAPGAPGAAVPPPPRRQARARREPCAGRCRRSIARSPLRPRPQLDRVAESVMDGGVGCRPSRPTSSTSSGSSASRPSQRVQVATVGHVTVLALEPTTSPKWPAGNASSYTSARGAARRIARTPAAGAISSMVPTTSRIGQAMSASVSSRSSITNPPSSIRLWATNWLTNSASAGPGQATQPSASRNRR